MATEDISSFVIRELTGDKRTLTLKGRGLPYRPIEFGGTQRNSIDWYTGSPIGTLQVYGAKEENTVINGMWKDKYLGEVNSGVAASVFSYAPITLDSGESTLASSTDDLTTAQAVATLVDDMRRKGQEVEVTWLHLARRGIVERFTQKWDNANDVAWEIAFNWISQAETQESAPLQSTGATNIADIPNLMQSWIDDINPNVQSGALSPLNAAESSFNILADEINIASVKLQDMTDALQETVFQATQSLAAPAEAARRMIGVLDGIKLQAGIMRSLLQDGADGAVLNTQPTSQPTQRTQEAQPAAATFGQKLAIRAALRRQINATLGAQGTASGQQAALMASSQNDVIKVYQASDNQDLRQVSTKFYGQPDDWRGLMLYNNLTSSTLAAGQVVFVPARPPSQAVY